MKIHLKSTDCAGYVVLSVGTDHVLASAWLEERFLLRAGMTLVGESWKLLLETAVFLPAADGVQIPAWICRLSEGSAMAGIQTCVPAREGLSLGWITLSDKGSRGERVDASGPAIRDAVAARMDLSLARGTIIPDEPDQLRAALVDFCLSQRFDMVFTTGGTGVGPRDITPEATLPLLDRRLDGFERVMTMTSVSKTPHGMISRALAGTIGQSVVVNLPGSPKAVRENIEAILPALRHTVEKLQGDTRDCGQSA